MFEDFCLEREKLLAKRIMILLRSCGLNGRKHTPEPAPLTSIPRN